MRRTSILEINDVSFNICEICKNEKKITFTLLEMTLKKNLMFRVMLTKMNHKIKYVADRFATQLQ